MSKPGHEFRKVYEEMRRVLVQPVLKTGWFWFLKRRKYRIIDGHNRVAAAKANDEGIFPVTIIYSDFDRVDSFIRLKDII